MIKEIILGVLIVALLGVVTYLGLRIYDDYFSPPRYVNATFSLPSNIVSYSTSYQFYPNMRYKTENITYKIGNECDDSKREDMSKAFRYLETNTGILRFFPASSGEDIDIGCGQEYEKEGLFVAGEGGPSEIINTTLFYVITKGDVLLLGSNQCTNNVALHELLHALGFTHSDNPQSVMYNVTSCDQTLSEDVILELKRLYAIPSLPELSFDSVYAVKKGSFLNLNFTIWNRGLGDAAQVQVVLYLDNQKFDIFDLDNVDVGKGKSYFVGNMKIPMKTSSLKFKIQDGNEIYGNNTEVSLSFT
jgi:hypothetical protein